MCFQNNLIENKNIYKMKSVLLLCFFAITCGLSAQDISGSVPNTESSGKSFLQLNVGPAFPLGFFKDDDPDDNDSGFASGGLKVGGVVIVPINNKGLSLFAGLDIVYNDLQKDRKDDLDDLGIALDMDINSFPTYLNFPISGGLHFNHQANEKISLYSKAGIIASFIKISKYELESENRKYNIIYDLSNSFGYGIGGGIILNKKTVIGIDYMGLGTYDVNAEYENEGVFNDLEARGRFDIDRQVKLLSFIVGIQF